jgi:hypothetical protein
MLEHVNKLLEMKVGDIGRLEHIKNTLENNKTLYTSDKKYVEDLTSKYLSNKKIGTISQSEDSDSQLDSHHSQDEVNYNKTSPKAHSNHSKSIILVGLVIGIGITIIIVFMGLHIYAISNLQLRNLQNGELDLMDRSIDMQFEACNPTFFPVILKQFSVDMIYKSTNFATIIINDNNIPPHSSIIIDGRFKMNDEAFMGLFLSALKSTFSDEETSLPNPEEFGFVTKFDVPILGVIPFSITKEFSNDEFGDLIGRQASKFDC